MKRFLSGNAAAFLALIVLLSGPIRAPDRAAAQNSESESGETGVLVDSLLRDIRDTLIRVRTGAGGNLELKDAKLNLSTTFKATASGKLSLWVVSAGATTSEGSTQALKITLQPPEPGDDLPVSATADALAEAILQAYEAVRSAELSDPPLRLGELEAAIRFVVEVEGSAGVKFTILPVTADLSGKVSSGSIHEIVLVFCPGACPG